MLYLGTHRRKSKAHILGQLHKNMEKKEYINKKIKKLKGKQVVDKI
jgi:hypothetical protein